MNGFKAPKAVLYDHRTSPEQSMPGSVTCGSQGMPQCSYPLEIFFCADVFGRVQAKIVALPS